MCSSYSVLGEVLVHVMCSFQSVLCAVCSLRYVEFVVCVMCSLQSPPSSLRACFASLRRAYAGMHIFEAGQTQSLCADLLGWTVVKATDEILPYIYVYEYDIYLDRERYIYMSPGRIVRTLICVVFFKQQTCLLCDSRHVCCLTQQTCLLCHAADMSAV